MKKQILLTIAFLGVMCLGLQGQGLPVGSRAPLSYEQAWQKQIERKVLQSIKERQAGTTVEALSNSINLTGTADACMLASIIADQRYLQSLNDLEMDNLINAMSYIDPNDGTGCGLQILLVATKMLEHSAYDEMAKDFPLQLRYWQVLFSLGMDEAFYKQAYNWAFKEVEKASLRNSDGYGGMWAALALGSWADSPEGLFPRKEFENRLEKTIGQFDWLKDAEADYESRFGHFTSGSGEKMDVVKVYKKAKKQEILVTMTPIAGAKNAQLAASLFNAKTNQAILLSLFAQANNFFAYQDKHRIPGKLGNVEHFFESWAVGGGAKYMFKEQPLHLYDASYEAYVSQKTGYSKEFFDSLSKEEKKMLEKEIEREYQVKRNDRFSDKAESFLFHNPTPGTDGKGGFADSANGRKHAIMAQLIYGLMSSYENHSDAREGAWLAKQFVHRYLSVNGVGQFEHYLGIALQGMRAGKDIFFSSTVDGWDQEADDLEKELYTKLQKGYDSVYALTSMQGAAEAVLMIRGVSPAVGEMLFFPIKLAGKGVGKMWVKYVPKRARVVLRRTIRTIKKPAIQGGAIGAVGVLSSGGDVGHQDRLAH